jgi:HTH-type transcriptional regulator / antitoxin HigA
MAILNHRDYRLAKAREFRLEKAIESAMSIQQLTTNLSNDAISARKSALQGEYEKVRAEIDAYEKLQNAKHAFANDAETRELGLLPILGRIRRRLSQRQLAEALGVKEQQIQRYESERYAGISLKRFEEILGLLAIEVSARFEDEQRSDPFQPQEDTSVNLTGKVINEIKRREWFPQVKFSELPSAANNYVESGAQLLGSDPFYRRSLLEDANYDPTALTAWHARIASEAQRIRVALRVKFDFSDMSWLPQLVRLSRHENGAAQAVTFLANKGIILVVEPHFQNTYLDGAVFLLPDRTPVVGLTLRHDRIDNFWFTLLHELGHIFLHYNKGLERGFIDDLDVGGQSEMEREADSFARSALIPDKIWNTAPARFSKSIGLVNDFAEACGIHPAIVAGRIQHERKDYTLFRGVLGQSRVRKIFEHQRRKE